MSFQEVEKILGPGPTCDSAMGMKSCTWGIADTPESTTKNDVFVDRNCYNLFIPEKHLQYSAVINYLFL